MIYLIFGGVRYKTTCLLISDALESVSYSVVHEGYRDYLRAASCKRGHGTVYYPGIHSIARVPRLPKQSRTYDT
jgi:hypothetical protein